MRLKKISLFVFPLILMFISINNVYADSFKCEALGHDTTIDYQIAHIVKYLIIGIQIVVPILLIVLGSIDFAKGITSQKEDEIAACRKIFIKRLISGALVFFVIAIVKFGISAVGSGNTKNIISCVNCFVSGPEGKTEC